MTTQVIIPAKSARAFSVPEGAELEITDVEGQQVADLMLFSAAAPEERFSQSITRIRGWSARIGVGSVLFSSMERPMAVVLDDDVQCHDTFFCSCSTYVYSEIYGVDSRRGCREQLAAVLGPLGVSDTLLTDPLNVFQDSGFGPDGAPYLRTARSGAGDRFVVRALMPLVAGVSACPDDVSSCNGGRSSAVGVRVGLE